jgi:hypothetical protein
MPIIGVSSVTAFLTRPAERLAASSRDSAAKLDRQNSAPIPLDKKAVLTLLDICLGDVEGYYHPSARRAEPKTIAPQFSSQASQVGWAGSGHQ